MNIFRVRELFRTGLLPIVGVIGWLKYSHIRICCGFNLPQALTLNKIQGSEKPSVDLQDNKNKKIQPLWINLKNMCDFQAGFRALVSGILQNRMQNGST